MNTISEPIHLLFQTLDRLPIPCLSTDLDGKVVRLNRAAEERFGQSEAAIAGRVPGSSDLPWPEIPGMSWQRQVLWWGPACVGYLFWPGRHEPAAQALPKLTKQRQAVLDLLQRGHSVKEIANELGLKESTVRTHIFRLRHQVGGSDLLSLRYLGIPAQGDEESLRKIV